MKKKVLAFLIASIVIVLSIPMNAIVAFAATDDPSAIISVENTYAVPGSEVDVEITIEKNPGIAGAKLMLSYDSKLTLTKVVNGEAFGELDYTAPGFYSNPCIFSWDSLDAVSAAVGTILTLTFKVSEEAELDSRLPVTLYYNYDDFYDKDLNSIAVEFENGEINVIGYISGDVNEDGVVNGKDVTTIRRYIAGGYGVSFNEMVADVNGDETINGKDVTLIRRYIAGGYGIVLPVCKHNLQAVPAKASTYTKDGNIAYWRCTMCKKYFSDAECKNKITLADTVIPKLDSAEPVKYTITYNNVPTFGDATRNTNPTEYTINDEVELRPVSFGYLHFNYWTDENGEIVDKIEMGTTGNKTLTAHWASLENDVRQASEDENITAILKDVSGKCYFFQKLGTIENIVLKVFRSDRKQDLQNPLTSVAGDIDSYEESTAKTVSNSVSKSVTSSSGWGSSYSHQNTNSASLGFELGEKDVCKVTGDVSWETSDTRTTSANGSTGSSESQSSSLSSTVAYKNNTTQSITVTKSVDAVEPTGTYRYVAAGSVTVYAVVTYDFISKEYFYSTFSTINDGIEYTYLYVPTGDNSDLVLDEATPLSFKISDKMRGYINAFLSENYILQFNINDSAAIPGKVTSDSKNMAIAFGDVVTLPTPECEYCTFEGWKIGNDVVKGQWSVPSVSGDNMIVTATAIWTRNFTPITNTTELSDIKNNTSGTYVLMNDINLKAATWTPISSFGGTLDGNGHKLFNFNISCIDAGDSTIKFGLFGTLDSSGKIQNLIIENAKVESWSDTDEDGNSNMCQKKCHAGIFAGDCNGTISNCQAISCSIKTYVWVNNHMSTYNNVGGICGTLRGTVEECFVYGGTYWSKASSSWDGNHCDARAGGIAGYTGPCTIRSCYVKGATLHALAFTHQGVAANKAGRPNSRVGGIAGVVDQNENNENKRAYIQNCVVDGNSLEAHLCWITSSWDGGNPYCGLLVGEGTWCEPKGNIVIDSSSICYVRKQQTELATHKKACGNDSSWESTKYTTVEKANYETLCAANSAFETTWWKNILKK